MAVRDGIARGRLEMIDYESKTVGTTRHMQVYTPPGYSSETTYPVLYLLHGGGDLDPGWSMTGRANFIMDNLIAENQAEPMIVVMPNGRAQPNDRAEGNVMASAPAFATFERDLLDDVIPAIEARYELQETFVAELASGTLPELYMWKPDAYRDYVNSFTLFRGTVLGVSSLAAVFLTIMFVVKGRGVFPATAAFSWAVLIYLLIDFGVLGPLLGISNGAMQPFRAAAEAGIATTLFGFLFIYLNLHRWHLRFIHLALALVVVFLALFGFAFFQPAIAATVARLVTYMGGAVRFESPEEGGTVVRLTLRSA